MACQASQRLAPSLACWARTIALPNFQSAGRYRKLPLMWDCRKAGERECGPAHKQTIRQASE